MAFPPVPPLDQGPARPRTAPDPAPYYVQDGATYWARAQGHAVELANFSATIRRQDRQAGKLMLQVTLHDGREETLHVDAEEFERMTWPRRLGASAIVHASPGARQHLRVAIQTLSLDGVKDYRGCSRLGWTEGLDRELMYMHAGGSIDRDQDELVQQPLDPILARFVLPAPASSLEKQRADLASSFELLEQLPDRIAIPLLGAAYHAPLGPWDPNDCVLFLLGPKGSCKSGCAAEAQARYGAGFAYNSLPGTFESTQHSLDATLDQARDVLFVVDDLDPAGGVTEVRRKHALGARLIRTVANRSARTHLHQGGGVVTRQSRALVVMTGEDLPESTESVQARIALVEMGHGEVTPEDLRHLATIRQRYAAAMAGYIKWLRTCRNDVVRMVTAAREGWTLRFSEGWKGHRRLPGNYALLMTGFDFLLRHTSWNRFLLPLTEVPAYQERAYRTLHALMVAHQEVLDHSRPGERFIALLREVLLQGRAHIASQAGARPRVAERLGWAPEGDEGVGPRIGWEADTQGSVYLDPSRETQLFMLVRRMAASLGDPLTLSQRAIQRALEAEGYLNGHERASRGARTIRRTVEGRERPVLWVQLWEVEAVDS